MAWKSYSQSGFDFKLLRAEEDYSYLRADSLRSNYETLKYRPLGKAGKTYLSVGGGVRYQFFYLKNENWGDASGRNDLFLFARHLAHADLHTGKKFRAFVQVQSSLAPGKQSKSAVDENALDLQQLFLEYHTPIGAGDQILLRAGRQELSYGSQRLVSVGEGPNNRQAFDAVKLQYNRKRFSTDLFYGHHVKDIPGVFNDRFNRNTRFYGLYNSWEKIPVVNNISLYYFGLWKRQVVFDDGEGREIRHSAGARIWDRFDNWRYDLEGLYQWGDLAGKSIRAWTISSNLGYTFAALKLKPEIGVKTEIISGDKQPGDNYLQTFNPLFPRGAYFGLAALIFPVNLIDFHPSVSVVLVKDKLRTTVDYDKFWRYSINDGIYGPNVSLIYSGKNTRSKEIGAQWVWSMDYKPNSFLSFSAEFTWFRAGRFLKEAGSGRNIIFTGITTQLTF